MWSYCIPIRSDELWHTGRPGTKWGVHTFGKWDKRTLYAAGKSDPNANRVDNKAWYERKRTPLVLTPSYRKNVRATRQQDSQGIRADMHDLYARGAVRRAMQNRKTYKERFNALSESDQKKVTAARDDFYKKEGNYADRAYELDQALLSDKRGGLSADKDIVPAWAQISVLTAVNGLISVVAEASTDTLGSPRQQAIWAREAYEKSRVTLNDIERQFGLSKYNNL